MSLGWVPRTIIGLVLSLPLSAAPQQGLEMHTPYPTPVLNAPYTATRITTTYQRLANGAQISHEQTTLVARDSVGRIWTYVPVEAKDPLKRDGRKFSAWIVWDSINYTMTDWSDANHIAWRRHYDPPKATQSTSTTRMPGTNIEIGAANDRMRYVLQRLPDETLMGLRTEHSKATRTVPAGKDGNDRDLTWTVESWYSPDLKLALATVIDDPVKGVTKYEFRDLKRGEPDPSLFLVPPGYVLRNTEPLKNNPAQMPASPEFSH